MKLTDAEWKVMDAVWTEASDGESVGSSVTARSVLDRVRNDTDWAYTTVKTIMSRLVDKGVLDARMRGNTSVYSPRVTREESQRSEVEGVLDRAFGGTLAPFMHFLVSGRDLSDSEREALRRALDEHERSSREE